MIAQPVSGAHFWVYFSGCFLKSSMQSLQQRPYVLPWYTTVISFGSCGSTSSPLTGHFVLVGGAGGVVSVAVVCAVAAGAFDFGADVWLGFSFSQPASTAAVSTITENKRRIMWKVPCRGEI